MFKNRLPPTLRKIGFTVVTSDKRGFFERADPIARHPITLTIVAFIFSGLVGTWLSERYQQEQRQQEAMRKNMDEVRLSIDTTNQAFDEFLDAASTLSDDLTSGADDKRVEEDREVFFKAKRSLNSKLAIETPRIRQAMPLGIGGAFELSTSLMRIGAARITDCINYGKVVDVISAGVTRKKVECQNASKIFSIKYVDEQIAKVTICVAEFYYAVRPSPFDDLHPERIVNNVGRAVGGIGSTCNGVTMLGLSYDQTYGKYKTPSRGGELAN